MKSLPPVLSVPQTSYNLSWSATGGVTPLNCATSFGVPIGEPSAEEITTELQLTGRRLAYTLAIPKGDTHDWTDAKVEFFGQTFRTCGGVVQGIESMIPLRWNKKVQVVQFE